MENETLMTEFVSVGLTNCFQLQVVLCVIFLLVSVATFLGNLGVITLIWMDSRLHSPMTFFLSYLSLADVCSSSVIGPKMLTDIFVETKAISFFGCGQCVVTECFLLASMAMTGMWPIVYTHYVSVSLWAAGGNSLYRGPYKNHDPYNFHHSPALLWSKNQSLLL